MKKIEKTFCELTKSEIEKHSEEILKLIDKPKYFCKKCLRVSIDKKYLC